MALHGDNPSGGTPNGGQDVVAQMTESLQEAYVRAGEDMGKQMAAAIVSIITQMTAGQGMPIVYGWPMSRAPDNVKQVVPEDKLDGSWLVMASPEADFIPLFQGEITWKAELASGHRILVVA